MNLIFRLIFLIQFIFLIDSIDPYDSCYCGELGHFTKIVGGRESKPHVYPWLVALVGYPDENKFFCGATIISSRFLITAGHCFETDKPQYSFDRIRLKVGAHNLTEKDHIIIKPKSVKIYEGYTTDNPIDAPLLDIALLELQDDLPVTNHIRPICLHSKYFNYRINELKQQRNFFLKRFKKETDELDDENSIENKPKNGLKSDKIPSNQKYLKQIKATDSHQIILNHSDKELIRQVLRTISIYYLQMRNDPIKIFDPSKEFTSDDLTVAGWGTVDPYEIKLPNVLMETNVKQKKNGVCENSYGDDVFFRSKMICANNPDTDSCIGDSGGPLMNRKYGRMNLYGVVSYGRTCGSISSPGVYTRISAFLSWLLLHTIDSKFCTN